MVDVQNIMPLSVRAGGVVRLSGSGFDHSCNVDVGGAPALVTDYDFDWLEFEAPSDVGSYAVRILQGGSEKFSATLTVTGLEDSETWNLPVRGRDEFRNALLGMMPRGFAWHTAKDGNWWKLFSAFAAGFLELHDNFRQLVDECSPIKTTSYSKWESELGLPLKGLEQITDEGRKNEIIRIARKKGGATVPYLKSLLDLYGVRYDLYEFWKDPSVFPSWVVGEGGLANFYVLVKVYRDSYYAKGFNCKSKCNGSLGIPRDSKLESILAQEKPAHVKIIYSYVIRVLTDMSGNPIVDDNNRMIIV